ncbi:hypothetical protein [Pararhodobacter oceanensis]|uniref:Plasmid recombination enzyme n=1 Tax=Pararhodobacter oceanensis TaxID=2172121 RepID=A0A2T8HS41_9RHOB|nr:hypothetical protein [Pararhodobacter oceanensis]PVH28235.1 hypothetical protein DDE20_14120 [Pararhodobacter oceanensis]
MPDIIFIHCQSFSRKPNRAGQCVAQVIAEGLRLGGYHPHVDNAKPPISAFGDPATFQHLHDAHVAQRRTRAVKNGVVSERAIRTDRHTLFTIVASYPVPTDVVDASADETARFKEWAVLTVKWVQGQYGDQLKVAFAHIDESYPHIHFWLLPDDPSADATLLHPGKLAKKETETRLKSGGTPAREAVKLGNRALKTAMRGWIDDYHRQVGAPLGMRRDGPKRRRLSRAQYMSEQAMLDHHRQLEADRMRMEDAVATLAVQQHDIEAKAAVLADRVERHQHRMRKEVAQVAALGPMLDALVAELEDRTITFDPEIGWKVRDPAPFHAAGKVWTKLEPAIRRLVGMVEAAEDGRWTAGSMEPRYAPTLLEQPSPF